MTIEPTESQSVLAYRSLEEAIVTLELSPGRLVNEQELCSVSGYGRTPVREAVQKLERDMLVSVLPRRGILIEPIDAQKAIKTLDVRRHLEPFLTSRAVKYAEDTERWRFEQLAERMLETKVSLDTRTFLQLDLELNNLVAQAARHEIACRVVFPLHAISRRIGFIFARESQDGPGKAVDTHCRLARAISQNDEEMAMSALEDTFEAAQKTALKLESMVRRGQVNLEPD